MGEIHFKHTVALLQVEPSFRHPLPKTSRREKWIIVLPL